MKMEFTPDELSLILQALQTEFVEDRALAGIVIRKISRKFEEGIEELDDGR